MRVYMQFVHTHSHPHYSCTELNKFLNSTHSLLKIFIFHTFVCPLDVEFHMLPVHKKKMKSKELNNAYMSHTA